MLKTLLSSRKFVLGIVAILALVPLAALRTMSIETFVELYKWIVVTLIAAIGVEGAAEKWNAPPPPNARPADSLKPPPPFAEPAPKSVQSTSLPDRRIGPVDDDE